MARTAGNLSARMDGPRALGAGHLDRMAGQHGTGACQAAGSRLLDGTARSLRLAAQDVALSWRKQGFESSGDRHKYNSFNAMAAGKILPFHIFN